MAITSKTFFLLISVLLFLTLTSLIPTSKGHNITHILAKYPEFSAFNHHLTTTGLAEEIDHRMALTVCVVDNPTMERFIARWGPVSTSALRHILSVHVFLDYYGPPTNLGPRHSLTTTWWRVPTLFEPTNHLVFGYPAYVNITTHPIRFSALDDISSSTTGGGEGANVVRFVEEVPNNISVIQISQILTTLRPPPDLGAILSKVLSNFFCELFAKELIGSRAEEVFQESFQHGRGLTVLCPGDHAFREFLPRFKKMSEKDKTLMLLYHGLPVYKSIYMLTEEKNGVFETLASDGLNKFEVEVENNERDGVILKTKVVTTRLSLILINDLPLAVYVVEDVLLPKELFQSLR